MFASSRSTHQIITLEGQPFLVKRLQWGEGERVSYSYAAYEPIGKMIPNGVHHSQLYRFQGQYWGMIDSYFPRNIFGFRMVSPLGSKEVRTYQAFRDAIAQVYIDLAIERNDWQPTPLD